MSRLRYPGCGSDCSRVPCDVGTGAHGSHVIRTREIPCCSTCASQSSGGRACENASNLARICGLAPPALAQPARWGGWVSTPNVRGGALWGGCIDAECPLRRRRGWLRPEKHGDSEGEQGRKRASHYVSKASRARA